MLAFLEALREQEDGHDGSGGIGDHRDSPGEEAHALCKTAMLRERQELLPAFAQDEVECEESEDDPADDHPRDGVIDAIQEQPADDDTRDGRRHHGHDLPPTAALAVDEVAEEVGDD